MLSQNSPPQVATVYLGLGSNLGDREANLTKAVKHLAQGMVIKQVSTLYETEPVGYLDQPLFLNAVLMSLTKLSPSELLRLVKEIEANLGRVPSFPNAPRPIDIDILLYGDQIIKTAQLEIPHPRLSQRAFVLVPLAEIAPGLVHPVDRKTVRQLLAEVKGVEGVKNLQARLGA